jgi:hypothetical protein
MTSLNFGGLYNSAYDQGTYLTIQGNGYVGIGTTAPDRLLTIAPSSGDSYINLKRPSGTTQSTIEWNTNGTNNWLLRTDDTSADLKFYSYSTSNYVMTLKYTNGNVGIGTTSPAYKLDVVGTGFFSGNLSSAGQLRLEPSAGGSIVVGSRSSQTDFQLYNTGNVFRIYNGSTDVLTVNTSGYVGIGTTSPTNKLEVNAGGTVSYTGNDIVFRNSNGQSALYHDSGGYVYWYSTQAITFYPGQSRSVTFATNGNVGIGTTSPSFKLDVNGVTRFQDIVRFKINAWNLSDDGFSRFYFANGGRTYFGAGNGYEWRSDADGALMVLLNGGSLGIGTTSPSNNFVVSNGGASGFEVNPTGGVSSGVLLQAYNRSTSAYMAQSYYALSHTFNVGSSGGTRALDITSAGNVGIGTTSPVTKLEILSVAPSADRTLPHNILTITAEQGNAPYEGFGGGIVFKNRSYTAGILTSARIRSNIYFSGNPGDNSGAGLAFDITPNTGSALTEAMRIKYDGNVGIGTTTPSYKLDVEGSVDGELRVASFVNSNTGTSAYSEINIVSNDATLRLGVTNTSYPGAQWAGGGMYMLTPGNMSFGPGDSYKMFISASGAVGIGTTNPAYKLDVNGNVRFSGVLKADPGITSGYGSIFTGHNSSFQITINADYSGGQSNTYTPQYAGAPSAGMFVMKQRNGGEGTVDVYVKASGTDGSTTNISTFTQILALHTNGNVGIGSVTPAYKLDVNGTGRFSGVLTSETDILTRTKLQISNGRLFEIIGSSTALNIYDGSAGSSRILINSNGSVGIGTTNPTNPLHVVGNATVAAGNLLLTQGYGITWNNGDNYIQGIEGYHLQFTTYDGVSAQREVMRLTGGSSGGNVGIGTTTPSSFKLQVSGSIGPNNNGAFDLGSSSLRWSTVYTSDLSMSNGIGDYTIVEGEEDLFLYNNKTNKVFKFVIQEVDPSVAPPKKS